MRVQSAKEAHFTSASSSALLAMIWSTTTLCASHTFCRVTALPIRYSLMKYCKPKKVTYCSFFGSGIDLSFHSRAEKYEMLRAPLPVASCTG